MNKFPSHINEQGVVQSCEKHSIGTAILARRMLDTVGLGDTGYWVGLIHDCGKFTEEFRDYIVRATNGEKVQKGSVIHSFAGVSYILKEYHRGKLDYYDAAAEIMACAVGGHHGLFDCVDSDGHSGFLHRIEKQPEYDLRAMNGFYAECMGKEQMRKLSVPAFEELTTILERCCSLNGKEVYDEESTFLFGMVTRLLTSALIDADRTDTACFMNGRQSPRDISSYDWDACLERVKVFLEGLPTVSPIQVARSELSAICEKASALEPGMYRLDMPTGGGKTLAGIRYAVAHAAEYQKDRIIYVAPLLSILDQNAAVIRQAVQDNDAILEHHSNIIKEEFGKEQLERYELLAEHWNSPVIITTMVQFLNTLFSGKTAAVQRFHSLSNSVIIIDEVQTVPYRMLSLFSTAMNFLTRICKATVVFCSATQPPLDNNRIGHSLLTRPQSIISDEIRKKYQPVFERTEIIDKGRYRLKEIPQFVGDILDRYNSLLIVCNKKSEARFLYQELCSDQYCCFHLSSSMCMAHRKKVLNEMMEALKRGKKTLCVSTQVIEAGVDISFNSVIRFTAGLDSIVQSAGRCNRSAENGLSPVYIIQCSDENLIGLGDIKASQDSINVLLNAYNNDPGKYDSDLAGDKAVEYYYHSLYQGFKQGYSEYPVGEDGTIYDLLSENETYTKRAKECTYLMVQAFKTAGKLFQPIENDQQTVLVPFGDEGQELIEELINMEERNIGQRKHLLDKLKPYTISVYAYQMRILEECQGINFYYDGKIVVLDSSYYSDNIGLIADKEEVKQDCSILIL